MKTVSEKTPQQKVNYVPSELGPSVQKIEKQPQIACETKVRETNQTTKPDIILGKAIDWLQEASIHELKSEFRLPTQIQTQNSKFDLSSSFSELTYF